MRQLRLAIIVLATAVFVQSVTAGPVADAGAAYQSGDYERALKLFRSLAEQGNAGAQYNLGVMYRNGKGTPQDTVEAVKWIRKAAEQGLGEAQENMGQNYAMGRSLPQDYVQSYTWLNLAVANGVPSAAELRDYVSKYMTLDQIAEAQKLTRDWLEAHRSQ